MPGSANTRHTCQHSLSTSNFHVKYFTFMGLCLILIPCGACTLKRTPTHKYSHRTLTLMNSKTKPILSPSLHLFFIKDQIKTNKRTFRWVGFSFDFLHQFLFWDCDAFNDREQEQRKKVSLYSCNAFEGCIQKKR